MAIINQLAEQLGAKTEWINSVMVNESHHFVDFKCGNVDYWAKLSRDNRTVIKNSVREAGW